MMKLLKVELLVKQTVTIRYDPKKTKLADAINKLVAEEYIISTTKEVKNDL